MDFKEYWEDRRDALLQKDPTLSSDIIGGLEDESRLAWAAAQTPPLELKMKILVDQLERDPWILVLPEIQPLAKQLLKHLNAPRREIPMTGMRFTFFETSEAYQRMKGEPMPTTMTYEDAMHQLYREDRHQYLAIVTELRESGVSAGPLPQAELDRKCREGREGRQVAKDLLAQAERGELKLDAKQLETVKQIAGEDDEPSCGPR